MVELPSRPAGPDTTGAMSPDPVTVNVPPAW